MNELLLLMISSERFIIIPKDKKYYYLPVEEFCIPDFIISPQKISFIPLWASYLT